MASDDAALRHAIREHALYLGFDPDIYPELVPVAKEALLAPLPTGWKEASDAKGNVYYYNASTKASAWEHPLDAAYRQTIQSQLLKLRGKQSVSSTDSKQSQDDADGMADVPLLRTPGRSHVSNLQGSTAASVGSPTVHMQAHPVSPGSLSDASGVSTLFKVRASSQAGRPSSGALSTAAGARHGGDIAMRGSLAESGSNAFAAAQQSLRRAEAKLAALPPSTSSIGIQQQDLSSSQLEDEDLTDGSVSGAGAGGRRLSISQRLVRLVTSIKSEGMDATVRAEREASRADRADQEAQHESETIQQLLASQAALVAERNVALAELEAARVTIDRLRLESERHRSQGEAGGQTRIAQADAVRQELAELHRVHDAEVQHSEQLRAQLERLTQEYASVMEQASSAQKETSSFHALAQAEREGRQRAEENALRMETQVQVLQDQLTHAQGQLSLVREKHERDLSGLRSQLTTAQATVSAQTGQWEQAWAGIQGKVAALEEQLQVQQEQNGVLQAELDSARGKASTSAEQHAVIQQVQQQLSKVQQQLQIADAELTDARNAEEAMRRDRSMLQSQLEETVSQRTGLQTVIDGLRQELTAVRTQRVGAEGALAKQAQEADELQLRIAGLELDLQSSLDREQGLQEALSTRPVPATPVPATPVSPTKLKQAEQRVAELQHAVDVLTGELAQAQAMLQSKGAEVEAQEQARHTQQAEHQQKVQVLEAQLAKSSATSAQVSRLQAQLDASDVEISALRAELVHVSSLAEQVPELRARLEGEAERAERLQQQLQEATATQGQVRELEQRLQRASSLSEELLKAKVAVGEGSAREAALLVQVQQLEAELAVAQAGAAAASTALLDAKGQLLQQTAVVQELTEAVAGHLRRAESVESQVAQARQEAVEAQTQAQEQQAFYKEQVETLNASITELRSACAASESVRAKESVQYQSHAQDMAAKERNLQQALQEAIEAGRAAASLVGQLQMAAVADQRTAQELRQALDAAQSDLAGQAQAATAAQAQAQQQINAAQRELAVAVGSIAELESKISSLSSERSGLQVQMASIHGQHTEAQQRVQEQVKMNADLAAKVQTLETRLQSEAQALAAKSAALLQLQDQLAAAAEEHASALSALRAARQSALTEALARQQSMENELAALHSALSSARTDASTAQFMREKAEGDIESLSEQLSAASRSLAQLETEKESLIQEKAVAIGAVDRALQEAAGTADALSKAEERVSLLQTELDAMQKLSEAGSSALQRQVLELRGQLAESRADAAAAAAAAQQAAAQVELLQSQHESATAVARAEQSAAVSRAVSETGRARAELAASQQQAASLQAQLAQADMERKALVEQVEDVSSMLALAQREVQRTTRESVLAAQIAQEARDDLARLKTEVQHAQAELDAMRASADEATAAVLSERDSAVLEAQGLREQLRDVEGLLSSVRAQAQAQAGEHAKVLIDMQAKQEEEVGCLHSELSTLRSSLESERASSSTLHSRLVALDAHLTEKQREYSEQLQGAEQHVASLSKQLQSTQEAVLALTGELELSNARAEGEQGELQSMLFRAESEASTLRERAVALEAELAATKADAQDMASGTVQLQAAVSALQSSLAAAQEGLAAAQARVQEVEGEVGLKSALIAQLTQEVQQQQAELPSMSILQVTSEQGMASITGSSSSLSPSQGQRPRRKVGHGLGLGVPAVAAEDVEAQPTVQVEQGSATAGEEAPLSPAEAPSSADAAAAVKPKRRQEKEEEENAVEVVAMSPASPEPAVRGKAGRRVGAFTPGSPSPAFRSPTPADTHTTGHPHVQDEVQAVALSPVTMKTRKAAGESTGSASPHAHSAQALPPYADSLQQRRSVRSASVASSAGTGAAEIHVHLHGLSAGEAAHAIIQPLDAAQGVLGGFEVLLPPPSTAAVPAHMPANMAVPIGHHQGDSIAPSGHIATDSVVQQVEAEADTARLPTTSMVFRSSNTTAERSFSEGGGSKPAASYTSYSSPSRSPATGQDYNSLAVTLGPSSLRGIHSGDSDLLGMARSAELSSSTLRLLQDLGVDFAGAGAGPSAGVSRGGAALLSPYAHSARSVSDMARPVGYWARKYGLDLPPTTSVAAIDDSSTGTSSGAAASH